MILQLRIETAVMFKLFLLLVIASLLGWMIVGHVLAIDQLVFCVVLSALVIVVVKGFVEGHREVQRGVDTGRR